jgi:hypothetical protein
MNNPIHPPCYDPDLWLDLDRDPEAPQLTDIDSREKEAGTDIVPPETPQLSNQEEVSQGKNGNWSAGCHPTV